MKHNTFIKKVVIIFFYYEPNVRNYYYFSKYELLLNKEKHS